MVALLFLKLSRAPNAVLNLRNAGSPDWAWQTQTDKWFMMTCEGFTANLQTSSLLEKSIRLPVRRWSCLITWREKIYLVSDKNVRINVDQPSVILGDKDWEHACVYVRVNQKLIYLAPHPLHLTTLLTRLCFRDNEVPVCLVGNKQDLCHVRQVREDEGRCLAQENRCHFQEVSAAESYQDIATLFTQLIRQVMEHLKYRADRRRYSGSKSMAKLINNVFGKRRKSVWWSQWSQQLEAPGRCVWTHDKGNWPTGYMQGPKLISMRTLIFHTVSNLDNGWESLDGVCSYRQTLVL